MFWSHFLSTLIGCFIGTVLMTIIFFVINKKKKWDKSFYYGILTITIIGGFILSAVYATIRTLGGF